MDQNGFPDDIPNQGWLAPLRGSLLGNLGWCRVILVIALFSHLDDPTSSTSSTNEPGGQNWLPRSPTKVPCRITLCS